VPPVTRPRDIPWEALDAQALSPAQAQLVGAEWKARMVQEHLAVGAFALITQELAETGCDERVLALVARASADEVRHADVCRRVAVAFLGDGEVPPRVRGTPAVPPHADLPERRALLHVVEMCCVNETLTGVFLTEMLARATNPAMRAVIDSLLADEIDHGRVGWAHLAACQAEGRAVGLDEGLRGILERSIGRLLDGGGGARPPAPDPALAAYGIIGKAESDEIVRAALRDVILPGFAEIGIPVDGARTLAAARGWA